MSSKENKKPELLCLRQLRKLWNFIEYEEESVRDITYMQSLGCCKPGYMELIIIEMIGQRKYLEVPGTVATMYEVWKEICERMPNDVQKDMTEYVLFRYRCYYGALKNKGLLRS